MAGNCFSIPGFNISPFNYKRYLTMMKFKPNNRNNLIFVLFITSTITSIILSSCMRKDKEVIGPNLAIASSNFALDGDSFKFNYDISDFASSGKNWFNASFNEKVSWEIKIKGMQSKAYKVVKGTSNVLDQSTSLWTGTHSGIYFFIAGEKAVAELSVYGSNQKWYDTTIINTVKGQTDYGPNALIWWDMDQMLVSGFNKGGAYFNTPYYAGVDSIVQWGDLTSLHDPVQGRYRSMFAKSQSPNTFWVGGYYGGGDISASNALTGKYGFPGSSLDEVYLNFYVRRRTPITTSMNVSVKFLTAKTISSITINPFPTPHPDTVFSYIYTTVGTNVVWPNGAGAWRMEPTTSLGPDSQLVVATAPYPDLVMKGDAEGWRLVSIRLDQMVPGVTFDPSKIISVTGGLGTAELTGFDMDFIVFTRGLPFDQLMDQNP
jgi:hypothetical protein